MSPATHHRPRRSVLYMPGSNERVLEKAKSLPADCLILDLEDAVAPEQKAVARDAVCRAVSGGGYGERELIIRVNGLATPWGEADLMAAAAVRPDAILLPKVQTPDDIATVRGVLAAAEASEKLALWAMMETPLAILNARDIAAAGPADTFPLNCFIMGTNDLAKDTRAALTPGREAMIAWLSLSVAAARAFGLDIVDGVYNSFKDEEGFLAECRQGLALGMDGKTLIHPSQIEPCNQIFSPAPDEIAWATKIIAAFAEPENQGKGAITVDGRMVELLHVEIARRTVAIAEQIARMGQQAS